MAYLLENETDKIVGDVFKKKNSININYQSKTNNQNGLIL